MTFSVVAWDDVTGAVGVAVATRFMAVGALCPLARAGVGALASQAFINPQFGRRALELLALEVPAATVLQILLEEDDAQAQRQMHIVDAHGNSAAFTGEETEAWSGHKTFAGFSVAGNTLVDEQTLIAMADALRSTEQDFPARLIQALVAGQAAGGDKRGGQSAALYITPPAGLPIDLRVDDHPDAVTELARIHAKATHEYLPLMQFLYNTRAATAATPSETAPTSGSAPDNNTSAENNSP